MSFDEYLRALGYQSALVGDDSSVKWLDPNVTGDEGARIFLRPDQLAALEYEFNRQNYLQPGQNFMLQPTAAGLPGQTNEMGRPEYDAALTDYANTQDFYNSQLPQGWQTREYGWDYQPGAIQTITLRGQDGNPITADVAPVGSKIIPQTSGGSFLDQAFDFIGNAGPLFVPNLIVPGFGLASAFQGTETGFALQDAVNLAGQGLSPQQIAQVLEIAGNSAESASAIAQIASTVAPIVNTASSAYSAVANPINNALNQAAGWVGDTAKQLLPDYTNQAVASVPDSYWNMTADAGNPASVGQLGNSFNFSDTMSPDPFAEQAAPGFSYDMNIPSLDTYTGSGGSVGFFDDLLGTVTGNSEPLPGFDANGNFSYGTGVTGDMSTVTNAIGDPVTERGLADILTGGGSNLGPLSDVLTATGAGIGLGTAKTAFDHIKRLFGGEGSAGQNLLGALTSPLTEGGGSALALAPALAAINYAKNQGGFNTDALQSVYNNAGTTGNTQFNTGNLQSLYDTNLNNTLDTSKMNDIYGGLQGNQSAFMKSLTNPYDEQTAMGRGRLTQSLGNRGVLGSSFGNFDLTSYDAARDRGRADIVAQGMNNQLGLQTNVANSLMNAQNQDRAYGLSALNAKTGLANNILGAQQNQAQLGLAAQGLQNTAANNLLNAQIKERELRNNLYGSALNALAGGLAPKNNFLFGAVK